MILIPHGWITSSVAPSRRENTIVVAGRALGGSGAREGYIRAWPARGPRTVRTSASVVLCGAQRPRRRGGTRKRAAQRRSAALGALGGMQWRSAAHSARGDVAALGSIWLSSARLRSVAYSGARRHSAVLGGARCPQQHGGARQHSCPGQCWFWCAVRRSDTGARRRAVALGGTPYLVVRTSPVARHAAASPQALQCRSWASPGCRSSYPSRIVGSAPMHGSWVRSLRGPRVRSHARSSGPFP